MKKEPCTPEEAKGFLSKFKTIKMSHDRDVRLLLMESNNRQAHKALGLNTFDAFLKDVSQKVGDLSAAYLRRQLKAAEIELELFGEDKVGKLAESALRVLSENVDPEHRKEVYEKAAKCRSPKKKKVPTAKQLTEAAVALNVYKQQEGKKKQSTGEQAIVDRASQSKKDMPTNPNNVMPILQKPKPQRRGSQLANELGKEAALFGKLLKKISEKSWSGKLLEIIQNYSKEELLSIAKGIESNLPNEEEEKPAVSSKSVKKKVA
jgi:hypothetical protein